MSTPRDPFDQFAEVAAKRLVAGLDRAFAEAIVAEMTAKAKPIIEAAAQKLAERLKATLRQAYAPGFMGDVPRIELHIDGVEALTQKEPTP